ncbi:MAG: CHAD domain-containing protein, partial [Sedimentibacter sp.]|uniref:CHAD domain-containing protein n=1 Tax=Sedimentibacter sp. TaxID=1960295 RepID=UPI002980E62A
MDVIFVRHGRAEDLKDKKDDAKRQLTPKGKKEIFKIISEAKKNLKADYKILIWTSSALRAEQTAQIISDELNADTISSFDFIKDGDYDSLIKQFDNVDENSTVFIVGHEPYLSRWSKLIYNARISFNKGTMVGFEMQSRNPYKGELIWIIHSNLPHHFDSTDKSNNDELTLKKFKQMMVDILNEITDMQKLYLEMPDDIEFAHQIRVKIRQLRSLLSFIKPILYEQDYKQNQEKLKEIAKRFSYIREIDVLIEHWQSILEKNLDLVTDKSALMKVLSDEREKEKSLLIEYISQGLMNADLSCIFTQIIGWDDKKDILLKRFVLKR